jgi:methylmalonyl-CoA mutase N-terminal domain/subunit
MQEIERACVENRNVVPVLIDAVDAGVTLGEVSDIYRKVFGTYSDPGML